MGTYVDDSQISKSGSIFRKILEIVGITLGIFLLLIIILAIVIEISSRGRIILPVKHRPQFDASIYTSSEGSADFPEPLQAHGNQIITPDGTPVRLRGLMPPDPARLDTRGIFNRKLFARMHEAGANVIRIPVHPDYWLGDADYLWRHIDPIVGWAGQMIMYAIIDWHYIGNIQAGGGPEMPDIEEEPSELTMEFWRQISAYFRTTPHVIFEIWNEPAGGIQADTWQKYAAQIIRTIRDEGAQQLVIVGGVEYSRDLSWVLDNPIPDNNVAYTSHIYPAHTSPMWDHWFGEASEQVSILVTEWGFIDENRKGAPGYLAGSAESYGEPFLDYLDDHGIGWVACWYDDEWEPQMFTKGWKTPTNYGAFEFEKLKEVQS